MGMKIIVTNPSKIQMRHCQHWMEVTLDGFKIGKNRKGKLVGWNNDQSQKRRRRKFIV